MYLYAWNGETISQYELEHLIERDDLHVPRTLANSHETLPEDEIHYATMDASGNVYAYESARYDLLSGTPERVSHVNISY